MTARRLVLLASLLLGCIPACSNPSDHETAPVPTVPAGTKLRVDTLSDEVGDVWRLSGEAKRLNSDACMAELGFDSPNIGPIPDPGIESDAFYVDLSFWEPERYGYDYGPTDFEDEPIDEAASAVEAFFDQMSPEEYEAYFLALNGTEYETQVVDGLTIESPVGGCDNQAGIELFGEEVESRLGAVGTWVSALSFSLGSRVEADDRYIDAMDAWRQCMDEAGYDVADFNDAMNVAYETRDGDRSQPSEAEREQAVADKGCQEDSKVLHIARAVAFEQEAILFKEPEYEALLLEWNEISSIARQKSIERLVEAGVREPETAPPATD